MADTKLTALPDLASPLVTDLVYGVSDPAGTPASSKITILNLSKAMISGSSANQVIYNAAGVPTGHAGMTYDGTKLSLTGIVQLPTDTASGGATPSGGILFGAKFNMYSQVSAGSQDYFMIRHVGANTSTRCALVPNGTVTGNDTLIAGWKIFGTDFFADETNNSDFGIYVTANSCRFNSKQNGTGTGQPFIWSSQDTAYLMKLTHPGTLQLVRQRIWFIPTSGTEASIATAITNATAGDTIFLGSGDFAITATLTVDKALKIRGMGAKKTRITSATATLNYFTVTADNCQFEDFGIAGTGGGTTTRGFSCDGTAGTVFSGLKFRNLEITLSGAGSQRGIQINDGGAEVRGVIMSITSSDSSAFGLYCISLSTAEAAVITNAFDCHITTVSALTASRAYYVQDSTSAQDNTLNLFNCHGRTTRTAGTTANCAEAGGGTNAILNVFGGSFSGQDTDIASVSSGVVTVYNATLINNLTTGTILLGGTAYVSKVFASAAILKQGANGKVGTFVCNGATPVTVNNTSIAVTDAIIISLNTVGGTVGALPAIQTITAGVGFTIAGTALDTSTYNYAIISNQA